MSPRLHMLRAGAALLACAALALAACGDDDGDGGSDDGKGQVETVRVGVLPISAVAPLYLGMEEGFFREEGLRVEPVVAQGGAAIVPSVMAGEQEIGFSNVVSLLVARAEGLPVKIVSQASQSNSGARRDFAAVIVPRGSDIRSPRDLEGKTIAVNTLKNIGDLTISAALRAEGVDTGSIEYREIPFPEMNAALQAGRVDAAWQEEPFLTLALDEGARVVLEHYREFAADLTVAAYFTSEQTLEEKPELVDGFRRAMDRSLEYAAQNPGEVRRIVTTFTEIPRPVAERMVLTQWSPELNVESIRRLAEAGVEQGIVESQPDVDALLPDG